MCWLHLLWRLQGPKNGPSFASMDLVGYLDQAWPSCEHVLRSLGKIPNMDRNWRFECQLWGWTRSQFSRVFTFHAISVANLGKWFSRPYVWVLCGSKGFYIYSSKIHTNPKCSMEYSWNMYFNIYPINEWQSVQMPAPEGLYEYIEPNKEVYHILNIIPAHKKNRTYCIWRFP